MNKLLILAIYLDTRKVAFGDRHNYLENAQNYFKEQTGQTSEPPGVCN